MERIKRTGIWLVMFLVLASGVAFSADTDQKLFVNLTSDEMNRAAMAISFSTRVLTQKKIPVTIFINVEGVKIVDKNIPGHKHLNGKTLKEMVTEFMDAGGKVIVCPMCMKNVGGLGKRDLIEGVVVGSSDVTWPALFAEGTTVLNY